MYCHTPIGIEKIQEQARDVLVWRLMKKKKWSFDLETKYRLLVGQP